VTDIVKVYSQDERTRPGFLRPVLALAKEIYDRRWHIWISFKRDFSAAHVGTGFGKVWNFVLPLIPIMVYSMLAIVGFFASDRDGMAPAVFVSTGATFWFLFTGAITSPMQAVQKNHKTISTTSYPLIGVVAASFGQILFEFMVRITATLLIFAFVLKAVPINALFAIFAAFPAFVFFFSIGLAFSILNLIYSDVSRLLQMFLAYMIFVSNVIIPVDRVQVFAEIAKYNPFAIFITNIRNIYVYGAFKTPEAYLIASAIGVVILILSARLFFVMEWRIRGHTL
jgi:homopolymeric O-antigen transport system permease protein